VNKSELEIAEDVEYGEFFIVLEAIRQQLTQGDDLLCPFWLWSPGSCCGGRNRAFLEKVWKHTKPDCSQCKRWERLGCLDKKLARFNRKVKNVRVNI
jgi:hypothetical protein